jgi:hypothetical protein
MRPRIRYDPGPATLGSLVSDPQQPKGTQQLLTQEQAAEIQQTKALQDLIAAATPLIQQVMDTGRATKREELDHELKLAELDAGAEERLHRRVFPLVWYGAVVVTAAVGWAAYKEKWEIVTHSLTAILAWAAGYTLRGRADHPTEEHP